MLIKQDVELAKIIDHPINASIYRDNFDDDLVESIKQNGVLSPVIVCKHSGGSYVCLSGHRRRQAAKLAGLTSVPCLIYREEVPEWQQVLIIVESNRQRAKTVEMLARETEALASAKAQQAEIRKKAGKKNDSDLRVNSPEGRRSIAEAAKETGLGARQKAEQAIAVVHKIDELEAAGEVEEAEELRTTLNEKSVRAAHKAATEEPEEKAVGAGPVDHFKKPVANDFAEAFATRDEFKALLSELTQIRKKLKGLATGPGGKWLHLQEAESALKDLRLVIDFAMPFTECGFCQRDPVKRETCDGCRRRGWVCEKAFGNFTNAAKAWVEGR
jgi:ParB-like chromosome segregation protein Spo0J